MIGPYGDNVLVDWYAGMPPYTVTPFEGIRNKVGPDVRVSYAPDDNNGSAANLAAESDVAIVFVGNHPTCNAPFGRCALPSEGKEAIDRKAIDLDPAQLNLIRRVKAANAKTIVVLLSSFPYAITWVQENVRPSSYGAQQPGRGQCAGRRTVWRLQSGRTPRGYVGQVAERSAPHDGL